MSAKIFKIFLIICAAAVFSFAQTADTANKQPAPVQTVDNKINNAQEKVTLPTKVEPKQPTNWSKIKDLFL